MTISTRNTLKVVVIGGGISGLSTAWYLEKLASENDIALDYTVLEKADHWGGKVQTETVDDFSDSPFVIEAGPDSFLTQKPWALQLARELGLSERLLGTNDQKRNVYVLIDGKPIVMPEGVMMVVPTKFMPFALSPLISPLGKLRMGLESFIPPKADDADETLADFIRRRLGNEALDKIAEPLMSGIYNSDADKQSLLATFPRFRDIEKEYGSLTRGMIAGQRKRAAQPTSGEKMSAFVSLYNGTHELIDALSAQLSGDLRLNTQVETIEQIGENQYRVTLSDATEIEADVVIVATPAYITAKLLQDLAPTAAEKLQQIRYVSTGTISLAYKESDIPNPLDGFGLVIPSSEKRPINAITVSSTKFDHRAPDGHALLRVFFGGSRSPESMDFDDEKIVAVVRDQLREILGIEAEPIFHRVYRWFNANPQYDIDHLERVDAIEADLPENLYVTGSPYRGIGMPDCVHQSQQTAQKIFAEIKQRVDSL